MRPLWFVIIQNSKGSKGESKQFKTEKAAREHMAYLADKYPGLVYEGRLFLSCEEPFGIRQEKMDLKF